MYIKKIICFIGIVLAIIILLVFGIIFKNKQLSMATDKDTCLEEQNVIESEDTIEISQEKFNQVEEIQEDLEEQETIVTSKTTTPIPATLDKEDTPKITKYNTGSNSHTKGMSIDTSKSGTSEKNIDTKQNQSNTKNQETKQETVKKDTPKNIKSYARNTTMENTMKEYIEKNPSENMKQYGFSVQADPLIVNSTNEFTYTEKRVDGKIKYKFGTIRIYAQDVLLDGVYQFTECFIL